MAKRNNQKADAHNPGTAEWKRNRDNRANQKNPNNQAYWSSRGQGK